MNKEILSNLKPLVSHQLHLNKYIDALIGQYQTAMERSDDTIVLYRTQGAITVLRRLKFLREEVLGKDG